MSGCGIAAVTSSRIRTFGGDAGRSLSARAIATALRAETERSERGARGSIV